MVQRLVSQLEKRDPAARLKVLENPKSGEVMVDFLASGPGSQVVEFTLVKYGKGGPGQALVVLQFSQRFVLGQVTGAEVRKVRQAMVDAAARFDLGNVGIFLQN